MVTEGWQDALHFWLPKPEGGSGDTKQHRGTDTSLAAEEFIRRHQNKRLLEAINDAYDDLPDMQEQSLRDAMHQHHRQLVEGQW